MPDPVIQPSVSLYTLHISKVGQVRAVLSAVKSLLDDATLRQNLIDLNSIEANEVNAVYPTELIGGVHTLSEAITSLEVTLGTVEAGIRGTLLYPRNI